MSLRPWGCLVEVSVSLDRGEFVSIMFLCGTVGTAFLVSTSWGPLLTQCPAEALSWERVRAGGRGLGAEGDGRVPGGQVHLTDREEELARLFSPCCHHCFSCGPTLSLP